LAVPLENGHKHHQCMHSISSVMAAGLQSPDKFGFAAQLAPRFREGVVQR